MKNGISRMTFAGIEDAAGVVASAALWRSLRTSIGRRIVPILTFCSSVAGERPEGLPELSRGLSEFASDTPGTGTQNRWHPEGVRDSFESLKSIQHPFRVLYFFFRFSGGISRCRGFNPRLSFSKLSVCWLVLFSALGAGVAPTSADTTNISFAKVQPVSLGEARWTSGFWEERFELCRTQMIPGMWRLMEGTNYSQFFQNFRIAAGLAEGRSRGAPFNDGDFYKWIEGASATFAITNDPALANTLDDIIEVIGKAQRPDGYLHTPVLIRARNGDTNAVPFQDRQNFEMYNMGHLMTAASVHYRVTGRTNLLAVAVKAADFLDRTFQNASPEAARSSVCPSHFMGLVDLYRVTHESRYLDLAKKLFALRNDIKDGGDDNQDRIPFEEQTNAMGHAVRANYLYAGAADLFVETGNSDFWKPLEPIWTNVTEQKMYITGGCGALYDGASPDGARDQKSITRVHQAYGRNYELPNTTAYSETCANIGNVMWNWRMFLASGESRFMDVVELALYNSVLSGGSLDGTNYFYTNPLRVTDPLPTELRWSRQRVPFVNSFCCPPNLVRTIAESSAYAYAKSSGTIWVNLYGASRLRTELTHGQEIKLSQETEYPWSGRVRVTIEECNAPAFSLKLRIPGWAKHASIRVNNGPTAMASADVGYFEIHREWHRGDVVDLDLPMDVRCLEANPLVEEDLNQVAFQRGPIVYCLESSDLPRDAQLLDVSIPNNSRMGARYDSRLLGGVVVLEGTAAARAVGDWSGRLYREVQSTPAHPVNVRLVPYFAWGNRHGSEMTVWLSRGAW
jgi:DUF1680 family protein